MDYTLTEVRRLPQERRLRLSWSDGHVAEYDYDYVRAWCPCAMCQGHSGSHAPQSMHSNAVDLRGSRMRSPRSWRT